MTNPRLPHDVARVRDARLERSAKPFLDTPDRKHSSITDALYGETYQHRGWLRLQMGKPEKALADIDWALSIGGVVELSLYGRAVAHKRLGQAAAAKADLAQALDKILNIASVAAQKGWVPRSAMSHAQDRGTAKLLARARAH